MHDNELETLRLCFSEVFSNLFLEGEVLGIWRWRWISCCCGLGLLVGGEEGWRSFELVGLMG